MDLRSIVVFYSFSLDSGLIGAALVQLLDLIIPVRGFAAHKSYCDPLLETNAPMIREISATSMTWKSKKPWFSPLSADPEPAVVDAAAPPTTYELRLFMSKVLESSSFWSCESVALALIFSY